jgi:hypothetical protein
MPADLKLYYFFSSESKPSADIALKSQPLHAFFSRYSLFLSSSIFLLSLVDKFPVF